MCPNSIDAICISQNDHVGQHTDIFSSMHTFIHFVEQIPLHNDVSMIHISVQGTVHATASNSMARWVVYAPATTFFTCKIEINQVTRQTRT